MNIPISCQDYSRLKIGSYFTQKVGELKLIIVQDNIRSTVFQQLVDLFWQEMFVFFADFSPPLIDIRGTLEKEQAKDVPLYSEASIELRRKSAAFISRFPEVCCTLPGSRVYWWQ